jgi:hypothetical protein
MDGSKVVAAVRMEPFIAFKAGKIIRRQKRSRNVNTPSTQTCPGGTVTMGILYGGNV